MVSLGAVAAVAAIALGMVLTPGPNMFYLVSRTLNQNRRAGLVSLAGTAAGFVVYMLATVAGLTAVFALVPAAFTALKIAGACYLLYLAWQAFRPGGGSPFDPQPAPALSYSRLFTMGMFTNLLNPKVAIFYVSLLPQFVDPSRGNLTTQLLLLGLTQVTIALTINGSIVIGAASLSGFLKRRPTWMRIQRAIMGTVLAAFAVRMALDPTRAAATP